MARTIHMIEAAPERTTSSLQHAFKSYCLFTPFCTAPGSLAVPVLCVPAAVSAPEVLASPRGEGALLAPVVPWFMLPSFIAPSDARGPTLPWLDAPPVGWVVCAKAVGVASAKMQAPLHLISLGFCFISPVENRCASRSFLFNPGGKLDSIDGSKVRKRGRRIACYLSCQSL